MRAVRRLAASCMTTGLSVTVAMTVLTACATSAEKPSENSGSSSVPTCTDVWIEGSKLPATYEGCMDGESLVLAVADAEGAIHYDDRLKAQPGGVIKAVK
jgi:hypothetical protein